MLNQRACEQERIQYVIRPHGLHLVRPNPTSHDGLFRQPLSVFLETANHGFLEQHPRPFSYGGELFVSLLGVLHETMLERLLIHDIGFSRENSASGQFHVKTRPC